MRITTARKALTLAAGLLAAAAASGAAGAAQHGPWSAAQPVATVNSPAAEGCPIESPDGTQLFIMSTREAPGDQDIWVASRSDTSSAFGTPTKLPAPVNSDANDFCPTPLRGKGLLFVSNRGGTDVYGTAACGAGDIYFTRLSPATGRWSPPRNLGCVADGGPNGPGTEFGPSLVETAAGTHLYFSSGGDMGSNTQDVYVSARRADGSFGPPAKVNELSTPFDDAMPNIRKDGLEMVLTSNRPGVTSHGAFDIWSSSRASVTDPWGPPVNLGPAVNTAAAETRPSLSWRADRLYFGRSGEIFVSTR
jgi:hypothetical protein